MKSRAPASNTGGARRPMMTMKIKLLTAPTHWTYLLPPRRLKMRQSYAKLSSDEGPPHVKAVSVAKRGCGVCHCGEAKLVGQARPLPSAAGRWKRTSWRRSSLEQLEPSHPPSPLRMTGMLACVILLRAHHSPILVILQGWRKRITFGGVLQERADFQLHTGLCSPSPADPPPCHLVLCYHAFSSWWRPSGAC
jgi:hypothetical protein